MKYFFVQFNVQLNIKVMALFTIYQLQFSSGCFSTYPAKPFLEPVNIYLQKYILNLACVHCVSNMQYNILLIQHQLIAYRMQHIAYSVSIHCVSNVTYCLFSINSLRIECNILLIKHQFIASFYLFLCLARHLVQRPAQHQGIVSFYSLPPLVHFMLLFHLPYKAFFRTMKFAFVKNTHLIHTEIEHEFIAYRI